MTRQFNSGLWTPARFQSFVKSALRAASRKWPPRYSTLNAAYVGQMVNPSSGRVAKHYMCAKCKGTFTASNVNVDHIDPIVDPVKGFESWDEVVDRMYCEKENLQILCKPCHSIKTAEERKLKRKV